MKHFKDMIDLFSPLGYKAEQSCNYAHNGYSGRFFWKRSETGANCDCNGKPPSIAITPHRYYDGITYELDITGELHGIWHKLQAYSISHDENLITNIQTAERALVAAWEAIAGVKA